MIIRENIVDVEEYRLEEILNNKEVDCKPEESIYFDLEHYVYKKPKCIGVFGACVYNKKNKKINYTPTTVKHVAATNLSFLYLPQTMGILLAKVLHMDAIWLLWFGRIMNLLCYGIIVASAVKIAPKWKFVLFFMASLPMSIQQAASFSPDAIINGLSILTIGYFIYLYD